MPLAVACGSFLTPTSPNASFAVTGVGFQGKLLLLWGGRHPTGLGSHADAQLFIGAASDSTHRWSCGSVILDNQGTTATFRTQNLDRCYRECSAAAPSTVTTIIDADFVSFDADGFTLNFSTIAAPADSVASRVFYLVLGGSDITNVHVSNFDVTNSTPVAIAGLAFQPDLLMLAGSQNFRTNPNVEGNSTNNALTLGMARSATSRWTGGGKSNHGSSSAFGHGLMRSDVCFWSIDPSTTNPDIILDLASFDPTGFTLDLSSGSATARGVLYVALKGTYQAKLGTFTQKTSPGQQAYTGVGFQPEALLCWSTSRTVSTTVTVDPKLSLGVALGPSNQRVAALAEDNNDPSLSDSHAAEDGCIVHLTAGTPTVDAKADLDSFDSDGFTLDWTAADATAQETAYLALASAPAGGEPPPRRSGLLLMGVGS